MREHGESVEFLEQGSRRTRIAIKTQKKTYFHKVTEDYPLHTRGYNNNMYSRPGNAHIKGNTRAPPTTHPKHMASRRTLTLSAVRKIERDGKMPQASIDQKKKI